jgi:hypothetical protein
VTRYEFFRKRIAPILFLGMVGLIAYDACDKQSRTHSKIVIDLGEARPNVRHVEVQLVVGTDVIGTFSKTALPNTPIGALAFETAMPEETGTLHLDVEVSGKRIQITRAIRPIPDSTTTVSIGAELAPPAP